MLHAATKRAAGEFARALGTPLNLGFVFPDRDSNGRGCARWFGEPLYPDALIGRLDEAAAANARGGHIFVRVAESEQGHPGVLLLDDLVGTTVERLRNDGWDPLAVVETSPNNHQCWIRVSSPGELIERPVVKAAITHLVNAYGADPRAVSPVQPGRLPGFLNKKEKHRVNGRFPWVRSSERKSPLNRRFTRALDLESGMASENSPQKEEIDKRRDNALRRALTTPPKPKRESEKGKEKPGTAKRKTKSS